MRQALRYIGAIILILPLAGCEKDHSVEDIIPPLTTQYLVGKTYTMYSSTSLHLSFFSEDSVLFSCERDVIDPTVEGRARYIIQNDSLEILNPYGRRLEPEEVNSPYFLHFKAGLDACGRLEGSFFYVGLQERLQYVGALLMKEEVK